MEGLRSGSACVERELLEGLHVSRGRKESAKNRKKDVSNASRRAVSRREVIALATASNISVRRCRLYAASRSCNESQASCPFEIAVAVHHPKPIYGIRVLTFLGFGKSLNASKGIQSQLYRSLPSTLAHVRGPVTGLVATRILTSAPHHEGGGPGA